VFDLQDFVWMASWRRNMREINIRIIRHKLWFKITTNKMQPFLIYLFLQTLYMFQAVPPPIIRST